MMALHCGIDGLGADTGKGRDIQTVHPDMMNQNKVIGQTGHCGSLECLDTSHLGDSYSADMERNACIVCQISMVSEFYVLKFENLPLLSMIWSLYAS